MATSHDLTLGEKALYHQVHPLKIATDVSTTIASAYLLARHELVLALVVLWVPSLAVTAAFIRLGDFSKIRDSRKGDYLRRYMTSGMQAVRLGGEAIIAVASWFHEWLLIPVGAAVIAWGWSGKAMVEQLRRR